jgi:predicted enzyme related to lactoylglutathione lyase
MAVVNLDRPAQTTGNIVHFEHVNVTVPDPQIATIFWLMGMGFTRDPYLMVGVDNMWINIGMQQFHLPTRGPQVLRGVAGIVVPDLEALRTRLDAVKPRLEGTQFKWENDDKHVNVTCPWGNKLRVHGAGPQFGEMTLGMPYVEFNVPPSTSKRIGRFYEEIMGAPSTQVECRGMQAAKVRIGGNQLSFIFRETNDPIPAYDGHHVAIYISDFGTPYKKLMDRGLISMESHEYEWRFIKIVDLDTNECLFEIEHEVRSMTNPLYLRPLVNRNAAQTQRGYVRGKDAFYPGA